MPDNYRKYFMKGITKSKFEGHDIYYVKDYYPQNRYPRVPAAINEVRNMIYDFKDGKRDFSALVIASLRKIIKKRENYCVIPIPASNKESNEKRYKRLMKHIELKLDIVNGFGFINKIAESIPKHKSGARHIENGKEFTMQSRGMRLIKGKTVILLDDIITEGNSFRKCATFLLKKGAKKVIGFFLGKTVRFGTNSPNPLSERPYLYNIEDKEEKKIIIFDLDDTLVATSSIEHLRRSGKWKSISNYFNHTHVNRKVKELVARMERKDYHVIIVTSSPSLYAGKLLEYHHAFSHLDRVCYHDTLAHKPDPAPYIKAIEMCRGSKQSKTISQVAVFGDQESDFIAADNLVKLGEKYTVKKFACAWYHDYDGKRADHIIRSL